MMELIDFPVERVHLDLQFDLDQLSEALLDVSGLLVDSKAQRSLRERNESIDLAVQAMQLAAAAIERHVANTRPQRTPGRCIPLVAEPLPVGQQPN